MPNIHRNISFALVNIPVIMNPAIKNNDTSFNQLHKKCAHRIQYVKFCPLCKVKLKETDIIKGYEVEKGQYLIFDKQEFEKLRPETEKEIEIISFVPINEIDPIYFEKSYCLNAETKSKAYYLFCEALKKTKQVALCKLVIGSKFYYAILRFTPTGIILTTLYFEEEVNLPTTELNGKLNEKELNLAIELINSLKGSFEPEKYKDEYQENIQKAIKEKQNGKKVKGEKKKPKKQVSDLMEALEKSLKKKS